MAWAPLPSHERLMELLDYNPGTGLLEWRELPPTTRINRWRNARYANQPAGFLRKGRLRLSIDGKAYEASRVIWKLMTGDDPRLTIDHRDRDRMNNKWENLRLATNAQQQYNSSYSNKTGFRGVHRSGAGFAARITVAGKKLYVGYFRTPDEAGQAAVEATRLHHGEFAFEGG